MLCGVFSCCVGILLRLQQEVEQSSNPRPRSLPSLLSLLFIFILFLTFSSNSSCGGRSYHSYHRSFFSTLFLLIFHPPRSHHSNKVTSSCPYLPHSFLHWLCQ